MNLQDPKERTRIRNIFFATIPKARKINPVFRKIFDFMYDAAIQAGADGKVLNVYASHDFSGNRERVYQDHFFSECEYESVDFWKDSFRKDLEGSTKDEARHTLPYDDNTFDVLINTKIIIEHVTDPDSIIREFFRVLKPGGRLYLVAPLVRRQHQHPHDYFRFTEHGLRYLLEKNAFTVASMEHTNGFMATIASYAYFFQRGLGVPKPIERVFDFLCYWIVEPLFFTLDRLDNGYGKDMTQYFLVKADKPLK